MERKNLLRTHAKIIRKSLNINSISEKIRQHISNWEKYKNAKNIMIFHPITNEISLIELMDNATKNFYFPVIKNNEIYPVKYNKEKGLRIGKFNIPEPIGKIEENLSLLDVIFIPALSADFNGYRLGYGKGFYDRFISKLKTTTIKCVPISSKLLVEKLIIENHDKPVEYIITENNIIDCSISNNLVDQCP